LKFIPTGIVDHVYDGVGYGIVFKIEGEDDHAKDDFPMAEAEGDDDSEPRSDPPEGEKPKEGPAIGNSTSTIALPKSAEGADGGSGGVSGGGVKRAAPAVITTPVVIPAMVERGTKVGGKGENHAASVPQRVRVGQIDCVDDSISPKSAPPRLLWGDREDEESLPSPLSPLSPKSPRFSDSLLIRASSHASLSDDAMPSAAGSPCSPAATEIFSVFSATAADTFCSLGAPCSPATAKIFSAVPATVADAARSLGTPRSPATAEILVDVPAVTADSERSSGSISPAAAEFLPVFPTTAVIADGRDGCAAVATSPTVLGVPAVGASPVLNGMPLAVFGGVPPRAEREGLIPNVSSEHYHEGTHLAPILQNSSNASQFDYVSECVNSHQSYSDRLIVGTGAFLGGRYFEQALINFGGIPEMNSSVRSSERIRSQSNADDTQMDRAMHRAELKNIGSYQGTGAHSNFFLNSISNEDIIARTIKLGVSLGNSNSEIAKTIDDIKNCDTSRTLIMLSKNIDEKTGAVEDTNLSTLEHSRLLSNDLSEEEVEIDEDILNLTLAEIKKNRKFKKSFKSKQIVVRRSSRLKKRTQS
jgi:hypothetical protein